MQDRILHNPRCSKSRETLALLRAHGVDLPVVEYLKTPPSVAELGELCTLLGVSPQALLRTKEAQFKALGLALDNGYTDEQWLAVLAEHPVLLERPIVVHRNRAALGHPPQNVLALLQGGGLIRHQRP